MYTFVSVHNDRMNWITIDSQGLAVSVKAVCHIILPTLVTGQGKCSLTTVLTTNINFYITVQSICVYIAKGMNTS